MCALIFLWECAHRLQTKCDILKCTLRHLAQGFESMAYYTAQSTQSERYNYVVWRVSNMFQLFDPMILLSIKE